MQDGTTARAPGDPLGSAADISVRSVVPEATVARLPVYLRTLRSLEEQGTPTVSSVELASSTGVNPAQLRRDLSYLGSYGTRGVGYPVDDLVAHVSRELGLTQDWPIVIVGVGNLGQALAKYGGFRSRGFRIAGLLDPDPRLLGVSIAGTSVRPVEDLEAVVESDAVSIGLLATPAEVTQAVTDRLVAAGITSILNFAPVVLTVPAGVHVRQVDLSRELQILAFHAQRRQDGSAELGAPEAQVRAG